MPVPIRDDGTPGPTKRLLLFVHGFNSGSEKCWGGLLSRLREDVALLNAFDFATFDYDTALVRLGALRRLPTINEIALELGSYIDRILIDQKSGENSYIDATLVGHSMGGLVIQSYLLQRLGSGQGKDLDRLRQIILFATPNFGSDFAKFGHRLFALSGHNPQLESLHALSGELKSIHQGMRDHVIHAQSRGRHDYPLPVYCFWGDSDNIVSEDSARGHFPHGEPLKGHHFDLNESQFSRIKSNIGDNSDQHYQAFRDALLHPHGHKSIWEVENFLYSVRVKPLRSGSIIQAEYGGNQRDVITDNSALVIRKVCFGINNRCQDPFTLRYRTRSDGWIHRTMPPQHVTSPDKIAKYEDTGVEVIAEVTPDRGSTSTLPMHVYKGFEIGHRDYHMHIGQKAYFRNLEFVVDLQEYLSGGWSVSRAPQLYFHPHDPGDHGLCANREMLDPDPVHQYDPRGIWRWNLEHVKDGVVDIIWDVTPPGQIATHNLPSAIKLQPGEHAIFGYGSLLSIASLERTLARRYDGPFVICDCIGWRRTWDVSMPNSTYSYFDESRSWVVPERILYLNIRPEQGRRMNGVLFIVNEEELKAFDDREWIYHRIEVTEHLRGIAVMGGSAWAYVGKPEHQIREPRDTRHVAVRQTYLDILQKGIKDLGPEFAAGYSSSTDTLPRRLIVQDEKRD